MTKSYHDAQAMDSREIEVCRVINKPEVSLHAYSDRKVTMNVIMANCLVNWGMLLLGRWAVDIPIGDIHVARLHREKEMLHHVEELDC